MVQREGGEIFVRGVNWIGDAVMTMPALRVLRRTHRDARISLLVKPWVAPIFEGDPNVDAIIPYLDAYQGARGKVRLARDLRRYGFSRAVLLQNAFEAAFISFLAGIPERIGYARDGRGLLLTMAVPFDERARGLHHIDYYLNLLERTGYDAPFSLPWIFLTEDERLAARESLRGLRRPVIGINPGATYGSSKRWLPERFAALAAMVIDRAGGSAVIFGGPAEEAIAEEISSMAAGMLGSSDLSSRLLTKAGKTTLRELVSLISECDALVTNDSGPMHIGYAVRTPLVAIFGSTSAEHTGPKGKGSVVVRHPVECAPCMERECRKERLRCMDSISAEEVFQTLDRLIGRKRAVFLDRDGTLCKDPGYLRRMEDFEPIRGVEGVRSLKEKGYLLVGVTNQSGIARGLVEERFVEEVNGILAERLGMDGFYVCPHHPEDHCGCRKPQPGLLQDARVDLGIDLKRSFVVGDKDIDMRLAKAVGATGILVQTGEDQSSPSADFVVKDIGGAVDLIRRVAGDERAATSGVVRQA